MQKISPIGVRETKKWESFVPFVYDDLAPVSRKRNPYGYLPWDGSKPKGTLTIGYGHTNDARHPLKCKKGVTITEEMATQILAVDLGECEEDVRRLIKVPLTQGQFDALVMFQFNTGALGKSTLRRVLNMGAYDAVPGELRKYVMAKGQRLQGLVNRRNAEIKLWNKPDPDVPDEAEDDAAEPAPKPTVVPDKPPGTEPKPLGKSKTVWGLILAFLATIGEQASDLLAELSGFVAYVPWLSGIMGMLVVIALLWALYGRIAVREEHGV